VTEEADLLYIEGIKSEALTILNDVLRYPERILRCPSFREGYHHARLLQAYLLANLGNWREALAILEEAQSYAGPQAQGLVSFYLGHCYLAGGQYLEAKEKLANAVKLGLPLVSPERSISVLCKCQRTRTQPPSSKGVKSCWEFREIGASTVELASSFVAVFGGAHNTHSP
jgi:tetratricopeptide (TPR) repeat protein